MPERQQQDAIFLDDAPKRAPGEDALGHASFADRLAEVLFNIDAPDGYVVGLHGPWGSGKSSVLNFVCDQLEKRAGAGQGDAPRIVRFEPWIISGHQDVTAGFMKVLAEHLPGGTPRWQRWRDRLLRGARAGSDDLIDVVATIGVITDHTGGVASKAAGGLAKKAVGAAANRWLKEPSLQSAYQELVKRLKKAKRRYLVIVDDIDRLTADEIRDLMRMVKTLGKLPHVVYLLAYDRAVVWKALHTIDPDPRAGAFAEKIVQQEVELPAPSRNAILRMLSEALMYLPLDLETPNRRSTLVDAGIARWVRQPRDVVRLSNALRFSWSALSGEIDPDDLVCMEAMRLHDRALFEWVRDNRDLLIGQASIFLDDSQREKMAAGFTSRFEGTRARSVELMCTLFPNRSQLFRDKNTSFGSELWTSVMARRGIATEAGYDAYFRLQPAHFAIPKAMVDEAVGALDDRTSLTALLKDAIGRRDEAGDTLVGELLEEIRSRLDRGVRPTSALLTALLHLGAEITEAPWSGDIFGPRIQHHFLISEMLKMWDENERHRNLLAAFRSLPPLASMASLHVDLARAIGVLAAEGVDRHALVTRPQLDELGSITMNRLKEDQSAGRLDEQPVYYDIARLWALYEGPTEPREWLSIVAQSSASRLARVARGLLGYSRSARGREYGMFEKPDEELYDLDALASACERFGAAEGLSRDEAARIAALATGLRRMRSGVEPE